MDLASLAGWRRTLVAFKERPAEGDYKEDSGGARKTRLRAAGPLAVGRNTYWEDAGVGAWSELEHTRCIGRWWDVGPTSPQRAKQIDSVRCEPEDDNYIAEEQIMRAVRWPILLPLLLLLLLRNIRRDGKGRKKKERKGKKAGVWPRAGRIKTSE